MIINGNELGLDNLGLTNLGSIHRNLSIDDLIEETVSNNEGIVGANGASIVDTGKYTGRSPKDKYIVDEPSSTDELWWGSVNKKLDEKIFDELYEKVIKYYNSDDSKQSDPSRCGCPTNPYLPKSSLGTMIASKNLNLTRIHQWNSMPYNERSLLNILNILFPFVIN